LVSNFEHKQCQHTEHIQPIEGAVCQRLPATAFGALVELRCSDSYYHIYSRASLNVSSMIISMALCTSDIYQDFKSGAYLWLHGLLVRME